MHAMKIVIFVFSLLSYYASALGNNTQPSLVLKNPRHDHYWLIQSWPVTFCSKQEESCAYTPLPPTFTVHGMWPVDAMGSTIPCPVNMPHPRPIIYLFEQPKNSLLRGKMLKYWPNLKTNDKSVNEQGKFWTHEWNTHGICSLQSDQALGYFTQVIKLIEHVPIHKLFSSSNITPGGEYPLTQYKKALKKNFKSDQFGISCYPKDNKLLLSEIIVCYDATAQIPISCKPGELNQFDRSCLPQRAEGQMIYFPKEVLA